MANAVMMSSFSLKPSPFSGTSVEKAAVPSRERPSSSRLTVKASGGKKIKTDKPYGINGGLNLQDGVDATGRRAKERVFTNS
ncbi:hypothetical protein HAX54_035375 [Datura stramonium]|uniref:Photosystem II 10 kDa polypeptide, chloroplastic n=1 Tax=Datura stramonium TaxID=4076 RepID=A0ABS8VIJ7_DATST|nr:hypothetical protein [Datura stramonium]